MKKGKPNFGISMAIERAGSQKKLAELLGCTQPNVVYWLYHKVPAERAAQIESKMGIPRRLIRPDLWAANERAR